ncbi:MAG: hypothetical protein WAU88_07735 [Candidatus Zixiibacteriota bacterium]
MAYTTVENVRGHLVPSFPLQERVQNQAVILSTSEVHFYPGPVVEDSFVAKVRRVQAHCRVQIALGEGGTRFSTSPLVSGSVVVASDSSLGAIFEEGTDYVVDYFTGLISAKQEGHLSVGQNVIIWWIPFAVLVRGVDYHLNAERGTIQRMSGGQVTDGESVFLDYDPLSSDFSEPLLISAVAEANSLIEREVDPQGEYGADAALGLAATYCALEIICRTAAARELSSLRSEDKIALAWITLADSYQTRSEKLMSAFRPRVSGPARPART